MTIPQTSFAANPAVGMPGQLSRPAEDCLVDSFRASEDIPFGAFVELSSGACRRLQTASAIGKVIGVALMTQNREAGTYVSGDLVPVLRKGRCFALWSGTTQVPLAVPNLYSSSTLSATRGYVTDVTTSASAGVEIYAAPSGVVIYSATGNSGFVEVELNLP